MHAQILSPLSSKKIKQHNTRLQTILSLKIILLTKTWLILATDRISASSFLLSSHQLAAVKILFLTFLQQFLLKIKSLSKK